MLLGQLLVAWGPSLPEPAGDQQTQLSGALGSIPISWQGGWGRQPRGQGLPLAPPQLFPACVPEASAGVGDESEPGSEDCAWGPDVITVSLLGLFQVCILWGEGLGQCQPVPVSVTKRAWEQSLPHSPDLPLLLLAVDGARATCCSCLVGL